MLILSTLHIFKYIDFTDLHRAPPEIISPARGLYDRPVVRLDIKSLYPCIIQIYNLCYSTVIRDKDVRRFSLQQNEDYIVIANGGKEIEAINRRNSLMSR